MSDDGDPHTRGAWGVGLATLTEDDRVLDTWYPTIALGTEGAPRDAVGTRVLGGAEAATLGTPELAAAVGEDVRRGVRVVAVTTVVEDLATPPADPHDAYLRLHLLSHRLVRPPGAHPRGGFAVLHHAARASARPLDPR